MDNIILRVSGLTKTYGAKTALDNVSFELEKGKIYGFIGENGAGKTTAIRAITGLSPIDSGSVELFGASDRRGLDSARKKIGCLVEHPILSPDQTARGNLKTQQLLYGRRDSERIEYLLERVGLGGVKNKKVRDFSLGMKQRLGIAMALVNSPELLILDEPVNGLDPMGMVDVRELLRSLCADDGITIMISSHILAELSQLATDYIMISQGRIIERLSKEELDRKCAAYIMLETDRPADAIDTLEKHGITSARADGNTVRIYGNAGLRDIAEWMFDGRILVTLLMKYERSLESYYMELLGRK